MKVAFVEQESAMGGVEYTTFRVARGLIDSEFEPLILCPAEGDLPNLARKAGIKVDIVPRPKFPSVSLLWKNHYIPNPLGIILVSINVFLASKKLGRYFKTKKVDLIITKGLLSHLYGGIAAKSNKIPCIWYMQEEVDKKRALGLFRKLLILFAERYPAKICVDAVALRGQFEGSKVSNDIRVIPNGIETEQFFSFSKQEKERAKHAVNIPPQALVIGQVGRIIPLKGQLILLDSFIKLSNAFPNLHLLFVGGALFGNEDYLKYLHIKVQEKGLEDRVHFTGFVPDVRQGLAAMDVFVHCSMEIDSPVSVLEAMSCCLPVIVSDVPGSEEMFEDGISGVRFQHGNSDHLISVIKPFVMSNELRNEIGENARSYVKRNFSLSANIFQLRALMAEILG